MIVIQKETCTGCGLCVEDCVVKNLRLKEGKAEVAGSCMQCGHCTAICPVNAVSIPEYEMDEVEEFQEESFTLLPENFLNAVKFRRSIRDFKEMPVEQKKLERIMKAGQYTESAVNYQDLRFILVQERLAEAKKLIWEGWLHYAEQVRKTAPKRAETMEAQYRAYQSNPRCDRLFFNAPVLAVVAADIPLDGGLASANMEMMAVAEGLGVMFDGYVLNAIEHSPKAAEWLGIGNKKIASCMLIGYPNVTYRRTAPRRKADVIWL